MHAPPPAANRRTKAEELAATTASSDEVGSSRITSRAGVSVTVKARAISTIWRWPIDEVADQSPAPMPWPGKISSSRATISRRPRRQPQAGAGRDARSARSRPRSGWGRATAPGTRSAAPWRCAATTP